jgi:Xaa-Pro aminopeptidase
VTDISNRNGRLYLDVERVRRLVDGSRFAALLVMSPENVSYLSASPHSGPGALPKRPQVVVWPADGSPVLVAPRARQPHWTGVGERSSLGPDEISPHLHDVRPYDGGGVEMVRVVADVLTELGVLDASLGVELGYLPLSVSRELARLLPGVRQEDAGPLLDGLRAIKSPAEVALLTEVNRATAESLEFVLCEVTPADTEQQIAARITTELWERGAHSFAHVTLAAGPRATDCYPVPSNRPVEAGQLVRTQWGIRIDGYCSATARNAVVGRASAQQRDRFARISEVHDAIVDEIRPGVLASDLAAMARTEYQRVGLDYNWGAVGHSIGLVGYEPPHLRPDVHEPVLAGMMLAINLGYLGDVEAYQIEDLVYVTADGAVNITQRLPGRSLIESQY